MHFSNVSIDFSNVPIDISNVPIDFFNIPIDFFNILHRRANIPIDAGRARRGLTKYPIDERRRRLFTAIRRGGDASIGILRSASVQYSNRAGANGAIEQSTDSPIHQSTKNPIDGLRAACGGVNGRLIH